MIICQISHHINHNNQGNEDTSKSIKIPDYHKESDSGPWVKSEVMRSSTSLLSHRHATCVMPWGTTGNKRKSKPCGHSQLSKGSQDIILKSRCYFTKWVTNKWKIVYALVNFQYQFTDSKSWKLVFPARSYTVNSIIRNNLRVRLELTEQRACWQQWVVYYSNAM